VHVAAAALEAPACFELVGDVAVEEGAKEVRNVALAES
jgi:hypothetical protein